MTKLLRALFLNSLALLAFAVSGCANWSDRATRVLDAAALAKTRDRESPLRNLSEGTKNIVLEVQFVPIEIDAATPDELQSVWQWTDETIVGPALRQELHSNGLRVGKVVRREPLERKLENLRVDPSLLDNFLAQAEIASEVSHGGRRIPMRIGRRYELPVRQPIEGSHVSIVRLGGELFGKTLADPQFLFAVTASNGQTAGEVHLRLRPEIQHGSMRQRWVSSDAALRIDTRRDTWSMKELDLHFTGGEGDAILVGATEPRVGLGKQMLSGHGSENSRQQVVMIVTLRRIPTAAEML
jgi:hypothetical protein